MKRLLIFALIAALFLPMMGQEESRILLGNLMKPKLPAYAFNLNQNLRTTDSPTFAGLTLGTAHPILDSGLTPLTADWNVGAFSVARLLPVLALTDGATQTITAAQCRNYIIHNGACTQAIEIDLPAAAIGMQITVYVVAAYTVKLDPNLTDQIMVVTGTAGDYLVSDTTRGTVISLICLQANKWEPAGMSGSWTEE